MKVRSVFRSAIPRIGGPKDFWGRIKSISITEIAREAGRPLSVAVVGGDNELRRAFIDRLYRPEHGTARAPLALPASPFVQTYSTMSEADGYPLTPNVFDFVIDLGSGRTDTPSNDPTTIYSVSGEIGGVEETLTRIFDDRPELALALARNFPVFRSRAGTTSNSTDGNDQRRILVDHGSCLHLSAVRPNIACKRAE